MASRLPCSCRTDIVTPIDIDEPMSRSMFEGLRTRHSRSEARHAGAGSNPIGGQKPIGPPAELRSPLRSLTTGSIRDHTAMSCAPSHRPRRECDRRDRPLGRTGQGLALDRPRGSRTVVRVDRSVRSVAHRGRDAKLRCVSRRARDRRRAQHAATPPGTDAPPSPPHLHRHSTSSSFDLPFGGAVPAPHAPHDRDGRPP